MTSWIVYQSQTSQPPDFADASNTSTRRRHRKSRHGCSTCKKRRIKCDETKPACKQCVNYGWQCSFPTSSPSPEAISGPQEQTDIGPDAFVDEQFEQVWEKLQSISHLCSLSELSIQRIALRNLVSHFLTCKEEWLAAPPFQRLLQQHGIQLGLQSPYLLHAILAITASHLEHLNPKETHLRLIYGFHSSLSLRLYREKLNDIKSEDTDALFACGTLHGIMATGHVMLDAVIEFGALGRPDGLRLALKSLLSFPAQQCPFNKEATADGKTQHLIAGCDFRGHWNEKVHSEISRKISHLTGVECHLRQLAGHEIFGDLYQKSFQCLLRVGGRLDMLFEFPNQLQDEYIEALEAQHPVALLLVGYWLALFASLKQWWITEPALALCARFHAHLLDAVPSSASGRQPLLTLLTQE